MSVERAGREGSAPPPGTILEDDQQLYDWGIENRLDQYTYQVDNLVFSKNHFVQSPCGGILTGHSLIGLIK